MVLFGHSDCIRLKVVVMGQSGCIRVKVVVFGQSGYILDKTSCIRAKWLYSDKVVVFG